MGVPDVAIPIARKVCVLVMRRVKLAKALYRGEHRPHQEEVAEELVLPSLRQVAKCEAYGPELSAHVDARR